MITLLVALATAQAPRDFLSPGPPLAARADVCADCHPALAAQWASSRHHHSLDNRLFLAGYAAEPHQRCVVCHGPASDEVRDFRRHAGAALEGITCVTCHENGDVITTSNPRALGYGHPLRYEPSLARSEFCATCHEFNAHHVLADGTVVLLPEPMQSTYSEWKAWGGEQTCQACHMPRGRHDFHGGHDLDSLRAAVQLRLEAGVAILRTTNVGHRVPTGDVFRHLVLWADDVPLREFGKRFQVVNDVDEVRQVLVEDSRLQPDSETRVPLPAGTKRVRLTYHYALDRHEGRGELTRDDVVVELAAVLAR